MSVKIARTRNLGWQFWASVSGAAVALSLAPPARAQTGGSSPPESEAQDAQSASEIIVTAQKRNERLIDVPQSVSVLSAESLEKSGATQFRDFADSVPGLSYQTSGPGFSQITLRGVTAGSDAGATVSIYIDDVPFGSSTTYARGGQTTLDAGLFDIDRIEVLRGPQGTLYGASSQGGLVKYVFARPDTTASLSKVRVGGSVTEKGGFNYDLAGIVNVPLSNDKAALRASAFYTHDAGYVDNTVTRKDNVNEADIYGGRAELLLTPTERLTIQLMGFYQKIRRDGLPVSERFLDGTPVTSRLEQSRRPVDEPFRNRFWLASGTLIYDLGDASLTSITAYQETRTRFLLYSAGLSNALRSVAIADLTTTDKFTQEFRLGSTSKGRFEWALGGFYTHEKSLFDQSTLLTNPAGDPIPNNLIDVISPSKYEEYAAFANATLNLTDKFSISGGIRYAHGTTAYSSVSALPTVPSQPQVSKGEGVFTYLANARYEFSRRASLYLRYATGYRPGGPNFIGRDPITGDLLPGQFEPDHLTSYEIGFKGEAPGGIAGVDASVYYIDWDNFIFNTTINGFGVRSNAPGGARIAGGDASFFVRPTAGLTLNGAVAYQDARLREAVPLLRAAKGERLPTVPRMTLSGGFDYELIDLPSRPKIGATVKWIDDRTSSYNANTSVPQYRMPAYTVVDLHASITLGNIEAQFYIRNLFDKRGELGTRFTSPRTGPISVAILQPRTAGITLTSEF